MEVVRGTSEAAMDQQVEVGTLPLVDQCGLKISPDCLEMRDAFGEDLYIGLERRVEAVVVERARGWARFPLVP